MKISLTIISFFFCLSLFSQTKYFVSTGGNNTNNGLSNVHPFLTIQFAIDSAQSGDSILVSQGTYQENIDFSGKNIKVCSYFVYSGDTSVISSTKIDGGANGFPVVKFISGEGPGAQLNGFTIQNGLVTLSPTAAGIEVHGFGTSPMLKNLIIKNNTLINQDEGAGMNVFNTDTVTILQNVKFLNNNSSGVGGVGGLKVHASNISMTNVEFRNNTGDISAIARSIGADSTGNYLYPLRNILIANNSGNICVSGWGLVFLNSTIANNNGSIVLAGNSAILNSIVDLSHTITNQGILAIENSLIKDGPSSIINPTAANLTYQDNLSGSIFFNTNNYKLQMYSPAIGHGQDQFQYFSQTYACALFDIDNSPRDTIGASSLDIGCYENTLTQVVHNNKIYVSTSGTNDETVGLISNPFLSIQAAVDYSFDNDSIILLAGTYTENVLCGKTIHFKGQNGASNTIWQYNDMQSYLLTVFHPNFDHINIKTPSVNGIKFFKNPNIVYNGTTHGLRAQQAAKLTVNNCWFEDIRIALTTYYGFFHINNSVFYNIEIVQMNDAGYSEIERLSRFNFCTIINSQLLTASSPAIYPTFTNCNISKTIPQTSSYFQGNQPVLTKVNIDQPVNAQLSSIYTVIPNIQHFGFVNPTLKDFRLKNSSPAIGYGAFLSGITKDFDGTSRPLFSFPDAGAYEHPNNLPSNGAPFLNEPTSLTFSEDQPVSINLTGIDDGDFLLTQTMTLSVISGDQNIVTTPLVNYTAGQDTGSINFTPELNANGIVPIYVKVMDNGGIANNGTDTTIYTLNINITSVNDEPVAFNDSTNTNEDTPVTINIIANDTDVDNAILANAVDLNLIATGIQSTLTNANGVWSVDTTGVLTFAPALNYSGTASITYKIQDASSALSNTAIVTVTVNPINDAPVAINNTSSTNEDITLNLDIVSNDIDVDNALDSSTIDLDMSLTGIQDSLISTNGLWTVNGSGILSFIPALNYNGVDSLNYTINDIAGLTSNSATVTVTINAVNDAPVATNDVSLTQEDQTVTLDLLINDYDIDNLLALNSVDLNTINPGVQPSINTTAGNWTVNSSGILTFTPAFNYNGQAILPYTVKDASSLVSNVANIIITVNAVNDAPVAADNSGLTNEDTPITFNILTNDTDIDNFIDSSSVDFDFVTVGSQNSINNVGGNWSCNSQGNLTFTPAANFNGNTTISYVIFDNLGLQSDTATITVSVIAINDAPQANNDTLITLEDVSSTINLLINDFDIENQISPNTIDLNPSLAGVQNSISLANGTFTANVSGAVTFNPTPNYSGTVVATYTVKDSLGGVSNPASIYAIISPVNDAPIALNDTATSAEDIPLTLNILLNDSDIENQLDSTSLDLDLLSIGNQNSLLTTSGSWNVNSNGMLTFTPSLNFNGLATLNYNVKDLQGLSSNIGIINISVSPVNDAPDSIVINNSTINENIVGIIGQFSTQDVDSNQLFIYTLVNGIGSTDNNSFTIVNNNLQNSQSFNYEFANQLSVRVKSTDQDGQSTEQIFAINVLNINDIQVTDSIEDTYCNGIAANGSINIAVSEINGTASYNWTGPNSFNSTTQNIQNLDSGTYTLTLTDLLDTSVINYTVNQIPIYTDLSICYVTGDTMPGNNNRIYFDNPNMYNVQFYQILRESSVLNVYNFIGQVTPPNSSFLDLVSNNQSQSYSYKVRAFDSCGNISNESTKHSTMLLQANLSASNSVNLSWTAYIGSGYASYSLYRSVNGGAFGVIATLPASQLSFNDVTANTAMNNYDYFVSIVLPSCNFESTNIGRSNVKTVEVGSVGIAENENLNSFDIFPNPTTGILNLSISEINELRNRKFEIINTMGQIIMEIELESTQKHAVIDLGNQANGLYLIRDTEGTWVKQLIINK